MPIVTESFPTLEFTVRVTNEGSVRVDLVGGTLDLVPINLIIPHVVTLNLATSLKAQVTIAKIDYPGVKIVSHDYGTTHEFKKEEFSKEKLLGGHFGKLTFIAQIIDLFNLHENIAVELSSGSPPGAGLGGSSSMGVVLHGALSEYTGRNVTDHEVIDEVRGVEGRILDSGPAGYQDYYPARYGGVLALIPHPGHVEVKQLYSPELKTFLESHVTLVYSGEERLSGITNWEVYKSFFDKDKKVREGLARIAEISWKAYEAIENKNFSQVAELIAQEGSEREKLFSGIVTERMRDLLSNIRKTDSGVGIKVCGAGGGGCFLLVHRPESKKLVQNEIHKASMKELEFKIDFPIER